MAIRNELRTPQAQTWACRWIVELDVRPKAPRGHTVVVIIVIMGIGGHTIQLTVAGAYGVGVSLGSIVNGL